jgi:hypothetical protein
VGNSPELTSDENSNAELGNSRTIPEMLLSKRAQPRSLQKFTYSLSEQGKGESLPVSHLSH